MIGGKENLICSAQSRVKLSILPSGSRVGMRGGDSGLNFPVFSHRTCVTLHRYLSQRTLQRHRLTVMPWRTTQADRDLTGCVGRNKGSGRNQSATPVSASRFALDLRSGLSQAWLTPHATFLPSAGRVQAGCDTRCDGLAHTARTRHLCCATIERKSPALQTDYTGP